MVTIRNLNSRGFTIVELLIVIVVIAILAAITIVAYNGITTRATESGVKSDLNNGSKLMQLHKVTTGQFPNSTNEVNEGKGLKTSSGVGLTYTGNGNTFCLSAISIKNPTIKYYVTQDGSVKAGQCAFIESCYEFNATTGTLVNYYYQEYNNPANADCPDTLASIPSQINGVAVKVLGSSIYYGGMVSFPPGLVIPNTITTIGDAAFSEANLQGIVIPNSVTTIGEGAFNYLNNLGAVTLPASVTSVGAGAFQDAGVTSLTISNPTTVFGNYAFAFNGFHSLNLPNGMTTIAPGMFYMNYLDSVTIPSTVTTIRGSAFAENYDLSSVTIPPSVTLIETGAFELTNLTTVSVKTGAVIQAGAFDDGVTIVRYP